MGTYSEAPNRRVVASNGVDYTYRDLGEGATPLVLFQHFRGNLDNWDPALIDALASRHRVVTFDNVGVGATTGTTPSTIAQMRRDAIELMTAMGFDQVDLLGYSIGSFVAQEVALVRPSLVRRLVLASSAPKGAPGMHVSGHSFGAGPAKWVYRLLLLVLSKAAEDGTDLEMRRVRDILGARRSGLIECRRGRPSGATRSASGLPRSAPAPPDGTAG